MVTLLISGDPLYHELIDTERTVLNLTGKNAETQKCHSKAEQRIWALLPGMKRLQGFAEEVLGRSEAEESCFCRTGHPLACGMSLHPKTLMWAEE